MNANTNPRNNWRVMKFIKRPKEIQNKAKKRAEKMGWGGGGKPNKNKN